MAASTIPWLELCGAVLLAKWMSRIKGTLNVEVEVVETHAWIHQVQSLLPDCQWNHVPSENNPADCASRGLSPSELVDNVLYWNGPNCLGSPTAEWVVHVPFIESDHLPEAKMENPLVLVAETEQEWDKLWEALEVLGIPKKYISLIKGCNNRTVCRVRFLQEMSETFEVKSGLRQGDALSPTLFNLALEKAMREVWDGRKMEICGERVILAYADDIVVMGETRDEVMNTASKLLKASKTIGLRVNEEKTKYLMVARRSPNIDHITVDDYSFKKVEVFKYLGVNINSNNDMHEEINDRIACGNRCYYSIMRLLKSKLLSRNSKTLLYHSYLRPIITYASETWSLTKGDSKRLMTFERKVLRNIYGPKFDAESQTYERRNNQELQELYNRPNIIAYIRSKRLEWFGHVWRADGQVIKEVLINTINKKRPLGRPRTRWVDVIAQDIKNIEEASSFDDAYDREKWRGFVMAAMDLMGR
ncbi:uncharacterized protein LOC115033526 [Acyrthosiphon pisum]|uniref:Reverse transcriptase domain-containing protein n=1 Tax=Acyrthosiphon pisum TaxID=7029 RepID=A0A8R2JMR7_ACYPI|nr:uncharacterized protein LOC115033526 [Acyrthosiphon pisum]